MSTIWKFPLEIEDVQLVKMPHHARILSAQMQAGTVTLWALVSPLNQHVNREIRILGTGHPADAVVASPALPFIGTVQDRHGLVWHIFDGGEQP